MICIPRERGDVGQAIRQRMLLEFDGEENVPKKKRRSRKESNGDVSVDALAIAVAEILQSEIRPLLERFTDFELLISAVYDKLDKPSAAKEYYTTQEVAKILSRRPYTVREWCRLGRVRGEKAFSGRGQDEEWRISHVELLRIQNEGLLPQERNNRVPLPGRLENRDAKTE